MTTDLRTAASQETAWARALYEALLRYEPAPLYDATAAEYGDVLAVETRAG